MSYVAPFRQRATSGHIKAVYNIVHARGIQPRSRFVNYEVRVAIPGGAAAVRYRMFGERLAFVDGVVLAEIPHL